MPEKKKKEREYVVKICFAHFFNHESIDMIIENLNKTEPESFTTITKFTRELALKVAQNAESLDKLILDNLVNWDLKRIAAMDRVLLQCGIAELLYFPEIPATVTLNSYIELAKSYGQDKSKNFVNGLLDKVFKELQASAQINK